MLTYYTPNTPECMADTDSHSINNAIRAAKTSGVGKVVIPRVNARTGEAKWETDEAILLPDEIEILLDNCYIRQADGSFDNVFRNERMYGDGFNTVAGEQHGIHIRGVGNAVIDGGKFNGLGEKNSCKDGMPHVSVNNMILMHNVSDFSIEGITFKNPRWWTVNLIYASHGRLDNLTFDAKDDVKNQDGIDLRLGCHDILISRIFGQAGDDLIALSGFGGREKRSLGVAGKADDICNVIIRDVIGTSVSKAVVALRNEDGVLLHDVTVDGLFDTSGDEKGNAPYAVLRVGQKAYFAHRLSTLGETSRITVRNLHAAKGIAIMVNGTLADSSFEGIYCGEGVARAFTTETDWGSAGAALRNVRIDGIYGKTAKVPVCFAQGDEGDGNDGVHLSHVLTDGEIYTSAYGADGLKAL